MKKMFFLFAAFCFTLSACVPNAQQPQATSPAPISEADIQATVAVQVAQTIQSLPSPTLAPSNTPVVITSTSAPTQTQTQAVPTSTSTETQNPTLMTLTATLGVGTVTLTTGATGAVPFTTTATPALALIVTTTGTPYFQYAGTMPPELPSGNIALINMSKVDASISLRCETKDGYVTYLDYPLGGSAVNDRIPAGSYIYVAWVGGKKFEGSFKLGKSQDVTLLIYKERIERK